MDDTSRKMLCFYGPHDGNSVVVNGSPDWVNLEVPVVTEREAAGFARYRVTTLTSDPSTPVLLFDDDADGMPVTP